LHRLGKERKLGREVHGVRTLTELAVASKSKEGNQT